MQTKHFTLLFAASLISLSTVLSVNTAPVLAEADCDLGDYLDPFNHDCPIIPRPQPRQSAPSRSGCPDCSRWSQQPAPVTITNRTNTPVYYSFNEDKFMLSPGYQRRHETTSSSPYINFDYSFNDGYQNQGYTLKPYGSYKFEQTGNGINLYSE
jgi:hypothetical protein